MTNQELFNKVVCAVRNQGRPNKSSNDFYRYRGEGGTKCAAGFLIPDDKYDPDMEGYSVFELQKKFPNAVEYTANQAPLVSHLQGIYDRAASMSQGDFIHEFNRLVEAVALVFDLKIP
jgi:hypothetical protein